VREQRPKTALLLVCGVRAEDAPILEVFRRQRPDAQVLVVPPQPHAELVRYYRTVSRAVFPSLRDGLPNALLEAMACGCSVIASQVGGIPEVITNDAEGWLVPPGDVDALAEALLKSLSDDPFARAQGRNARQRVELEFTDERERALDLQLLERLLPAR
jgi:glycosyltransferase involved in cell wall biosynthesis